MGEICGDYSGHKVHDCLMGNEAVWSGRYLTPERFVMSRTPPLDLTTPIQIRLLIIAHIQTLERKTGVNKFAVRNKY
jgi:hypothetical protein